MRSQRQPLNTFSIIIIGFGLFAAQFTWVVYNTYVPIFLQAGSPQFEALTRSTLHGFGLTATQTGFLLTLDNIAALFLQPLTGALSDRTHTRFGRRMPYLLLGMPLAAAGMALIPLFLPEFGGRFVIFLAALLAMVIAMAYWRAPLFALMADLTPSPFRTHANGILNLLAGLGGVLAFVISSFLYAIYRPFPFWMAALVLLLACSLIFGIVRDPAASKSFDAPSAPKFFHGLRTWLSSLSPARRQSLFFLALAVFCYMMGFHPIEAFFSSYGVSVLKLSEANSGLILSAAYVSFILFAVPAGMLASKIGRRRAVFIGLGLFATVLVIAFFTPVITPMIILMALGGLAWALIDINAFPMVLDTAPGADGSGLGTATGVYFIATTLAATAGPILNGWLIDLSGRNYSLIFLMGPAFFALSFFFMLRVKHGEAMDVKVS